MVIFKTVEKTVYQRSVQKLTPFEIITEKNELCNNKSVNAGLTPEIFQEQERFREIRALREAFFQKVEKKGPEGENFGVFCPRYSQNPILNGQI